MLCNRKISNMIVGNENTARVPIGAGRSRQMYMTNKEVFFNTSMLLSGADATDLAAY
jgi:hypothetical protein